MNPSLSPQDSLFEKRLADALRDGTAPASAPGAAATVARCRARLGKSRRFPAARLAVAAALALLLGGLAWWRVAGNGVLGPAEAPVVAEAADGNPASEVAAADETSLVALREAPLADEFEQMESFLVELASIRISYDWSFDDAETVN